MTSIARILVCATGVAVGIASLAACSADDKRKSEQHGITTASPSVSAPVTPGTPTARTPQEQAVASYVALQLAYLEATKRADPAHPDLAKYASGDALQQLTAGVASIRSKGLRGQGNVVPHPSIESMTPANAPVQARVHDCLDTSQSELYKANGDPYQDTPGGLRLVIADLERIGGTWKVTGLGVHEAGSCKLPSTS